MIYDGTHRALKSRLGNKSARLINGAQAAIRHLLSMDAIVERASTSSLNRTQEEMVATYISFSLLGTLNPL